MLLLRVISINKLFPELVSGKVVLEDLHSTASTCICEQFARFSACDLKRVLVTWRARTVCEAQRGGGRLISRAERCRWRVQDIFFALQVEIDRVQLTVLQSSLCNNKEDKLFDANVINSGNKVEFVFTFLNE